jgi:hypothetical protein
VTAPVQDKGRPCSRQACKAPNPHWHCKECGYPIEGEGVCGECACEEDW